mmetsp:Transcript_24944/g.46161  ORF Transcript_24944/g.46161 Transcript_24944/m.46161 type:complete len:470 (-) Transcript_24944:272-1681(-)
MGKKKRREVHSSSIAGSAKGKRNSGDLKRDSSDGGQRFGAPSAHARNGTADGAAEEDRARFLSEHLIVGAVLPAVLTAVAFVLGSSPDLQSSEGGIQRPHFLARLVLSVFLDATYGEAFSAWILPASRSLARRLPGAAVPSTAGGCERQEGQPNDPTLEWPVPGTDLPPEWICHRIAAAASEGRERVERKGDGRQPYFLNHVRGSTRVRQAAKRVSSAFGTLSMALVMSRFVDGTSLSYIGLELSLLDLTAGFAVGAGSVLALFFAEIALGWIRIVGYNEVVAPGESLSINLLWDVLFHVGVSFNEEVSLRGWVLVHAAAYIFSLGTPAASAMVLSASLQAAIFALLHLSSPGASRVGLINLVVGGSAAALNVVLSGGLSFPLGWHFGWNIFMGHLLGMSTSGIPMSAKLVSVVPHPAKPHLHGGKFGPEQSPLAPVAYLLGCVCLVILYGTDGVAIWREKLEAALQSQ